MLLPILQRAFALVSLVLLALGGYLLWWGWRLHEALRPNDSYIDTQDWRLWVGGALIAWSLLGRLPVALLLGRRAGDGDRLKRQPGVELETTTGAKLHLEANGPDEAPVLVFVHGWAMDASIWWEARHMLAKRYHMVSYDLAGLGKSSAFADGRYSLEKFADDLLDVVGRASPRKVILVGHSIGGMIIQTFCRRYPETLNRQVLGIVLENTTHTAPTRTTILGEGLHALKPLLELVMRLDIVLQPLVWLMNWQSYLSGSTHVAMRYGGFGTEPTKAQLNQVSLLATRNSPAVQAKGNIAMMNWGATDDLPAIRVPALVFIGGRDLVTVAAAGESIARGLPQARPMHMAEAGHMGPVELAQEYNTAIAAFADEVFTRGAQSADTAAASQAVEPRAPGERRPPVEPRPFA